MHPIAVYCELLGLRPMRITSSTWPRIRHHKSDHERQLATHGYGRWTAELSGILTEYYAITWEEIPDELLDTLSIELINTLRDHP